MTTFVKLYVQGELSKMPVVYDRFGTNGLRALSKEMNYRVQILAFLCIAVFMIFPS
jgi:hypothetical protein